MKILFIRSFKEKFTQLKMSFKYLKNWKLFIFKGLIKLIMPFIASKDLLPQALEFGNMLVKMFFCWSWGFNGCLINFQLWNVEFLLFHERLNVLLTRVSRNRDCPDEPLSVWEMNFVSDHIVLPQLSWQCVACSGQSQIRSCSFISRARCSFIFNENLPWMHFEREVVFFSTPS